MPRIRFLEAARNDQRTDGLCITVRQVESRQCAEIFLRQRFREFDVAGDTANELPGCLVRVLFQVDLGRRELWSGHQDDRNLVIGQSRHHPVDPTGKNSTSARTHCKSLLRQIQAQARCKRASYMKA
jgi:hypothetical protein